MLKLRLIYIAPLYLKINYFHVLHHVYFILEGFNIKDFTLLKAHLKVLIFL